MKTKEQIKEILMSNFDSVYCNTCGNEDCDECHRKAMNWGISEKFAEKVANSILNEE